MSKIGVFICHCGENIGATIDCEKVAAEAAKFDGVAFATDYKYMCSDPGQSLIRKAIEEQKLDGVVVAACSPRMHEPTFRRACSEAGLNPYLCEMANLREHCSWVHEKGEPTTAKAIDIVRGLVEKVKRNKPLKPIEVPITKKALVIGGGIAGIQAALDIANCGHQVILVEKEPSIGGHMSQLSETFPTLDCSQCILTPRMVEVAQHPNIKLYTYAELEHLDGFIGNFKATIRLKAKSVDEKICTGCGLCTTKCPQKRISSEFNAGLGLRTAIYVPFPQAVPNKPVIDKKHCNYYKRGKCKICEKTCPTGAICFDKEDEFVTEDIGAVVVATGFNVLGTEFFPEYGYGRYKDVITGLQFERLASASGPTSGEIRRPSDGTMPKKIVFIACAGSRDPAKGIHYCSKICCMYTAKHAMLYQHKVHGGESYVFYMDIRAAGKNYEEFVRRAIEDDGVNYVRGRVARIYEKDGKLIVKGVDTLMGAQPVEIEADMVVLATAGVSNEGAEELAQRLHVSYDPYKFFAEAHPKLKPVETNTAGIYVAGACQAPRDIPETVSMASGAAAKVAALFSSDKLVREPLIAVVNRMAPPVYSTCVGCFMCQTACPYQAIEREEIKDRGGNVVKTVARVNPGLCQGCGTCVAFCRSKSIDIQGYSNDQMYAEVMALLHTQGA
ncbi:MULTISPECIES: CoB--CoM heterodisulfide reductase iron-sulfur subunit A family protein [Alistipes]|uniref:CoB--CoM heterodisulfide reductase iron-sulfur subunit A family protein n=1 Tax=Alistipes hominis TaxID=2763015 RepID=A0ABR7CP37_9BACT|nr:MULTISPECIES: CoB--CoM heterodisulfide reductase iron-sulfur subunit A family protein [Alistipes]MBC5617429.1 CoB--CoM heterodisulfide reductase iron-sulfur subunit A family protein [Alistipes hominis]MBS1413959.1 CoB--CoM heterodisulfide reductase iron-sulfur subunit A family protein [Alistipes sp.]RHR63232.1 CoB--CoM heterodisulfide reductase iron-sulfur subunit A family protein [Alistipes sp. AF17-16]